MFVFQDATVADEEDKTEVEEGEGELEGDSLAEDWDTLEPGGDADQSRLYLFARTGRDKEDWFRRLAAAVRPPTLPMSQGAEQRSSATEREVEPNASARDESDVSLSSEPNDATSIRSLTEEGVSTASGVAAVSASPPAAMDEYLEFMSGFGHLRHDNRTITHLLNKRKKKTHLFVCNSVHVLVCT